MACVLTSSLPLDCRDASGGIKEIKVKIHPGLATIGTDFAVTSGVVAIASGSRSLWYTYGMEKQTASFDETVNVSVPNGTRFFKQDLKFIFNKLSAKLFYEVNLLAQNRLLFAVRDMNDVYWILGMDYGMDMTSSKASTGTARGDRSGYELAFEGQESQTIPNITAAGYNQLITA